MHDGKARIAGSALEETEKSRNQKPGQGGARRDLSPVPDLLFSPGGGNAFPLGINCQLATCQITKVLEITWKGRKV